MSNTMLNTICMYNSNIGIDNTIFDELEFVVIILLLKDDMDRNTKRKTKILVIYTENFAEHTTEFSCQQYANEKVIIILIIIVLHLIMYHLMVMMIKILIQII